MLFRSLQETTFTGSRISCHLFRLTYAHRVSLPCCHSNRDHLAVLSHQSHHNSLGSPLSTRRQVPSSPPQLNTASHSDLGSGSGQRLFPSSPRSMQITPVPTGPVPPKSSISRPLSPVIAKMVPCASGAYPQDASGDLSRKPRGLEPFGPPPQESSASRQDVYRQNGSSQTLETHEVRSVGMTLAGVGSGSTGIPKIGRASCRERV